MNYELLKLSKILPTINGRKTLDIYQERLDMARKARDEALGITSEQREAAPKQTIKVKKHTRAQREKADAYESEQKLTGVKSTDALPTNDKLNGMMEGFSNLNALLHDREPFESLAKMVSTSSLNKPKKHVVNLKVTPGMPFYAQKEQGGVTTPSRPSSISSNPPSNFVFKKKKIILRDTNELDHVYHYSLGSGFTLLSDEALGLNGRKVNLKELDHEIMVKQQKKYLKDMKADPMTTFQSPSRDAPDSPPGGVATFFSTGSHVFNRKSQEKNGGDAAKGSAGENAADKNGKMSTVVFDGTYLKSFDKSPQGSNNNSPAKSNKGFF